ncbi:MAG: hemolysin family protein [Ilumatobacteraceae bacterium]
MRIVVGLFAIGFLIVANGFFVAAEFAYVAVERTALENAAAGGDRVAGRAVGVLHRLSFMLSGAQLGITATSLLVGFIAEPVSRAALDPLLGALGVPTGSRPAVSVIVGFLLVTLGQMIIAELVPKNLAIARPERVARLTAGPMTVFMRVFGPLIGFFDAASNRLLRSVGIEPVEELSDIVSVEEFNTILTESVREGSLSATQAGLFERVLTFRELHAGQVATHRGDASTIDASATCDVLEQMVAAGHSRFPVMSDGDVVGVVQARTLLELDRADWPRTAVRALMTEPVVVSEAALLTSVLHSLRSADAEMAVVIDEYGGFVGLITTEDLAEELVGEIQDETDPAPATARHPNDAVWFVPGAWRLDEVFDATGLVLPEGPYETIAGLVLTELGRMAAAGDRVQIAGFRFRVVATRGRRITEVAVEAVPHGPLA